MLIHGDSLEDDSHLRCDAAIIGAGPAGIVITLELAAAGLDVILIESGGLEYSDKNQKLADAASFDPEFHAPMSECTRRIIGGASTIWGGRCVPFDPLDFDDRPYISDSPWPVEYADIASYYQRASDWFFCGKAEFDINNLPDIPQKTLVPGMPDGDVLTSKLERWSLPTNFGREYADALRQHNHVRLLHNLTCTEIICDDPGKTDTIIARTLSGKSIRISGKFHVVACGGIESARLLMSSDRTHAGGIGNHSDMLGRNYMGHVSGRIANVHFDTPPNDTIYGFDRDPEGVYLRRRLTFSREFHHEKELPNIVAWLVNPDIHDATHSNGILSLVYLLLTSPVIGKRLASEAIRKAAAGGLKQKDLLKHLRNVVTDLPATMKFMATFGFSRIVSRRKPPGFFTFSKSNVYPLHFFCEHTPDPESRITLSKERDATGMRRVDINLRYSEKDVNNVIRAHEYWDEYLQKHGCGRLEYLFDDPEQKILEQVVDGFHQVGTTRMSADPGKGVVDENCRIHGISNLYVASSSIFVTSGQANSTFTIVAFALRLADHLKQLHKTG